MSVIIETEVFTLSELVDRGDDRAVDRALEWMLESWNYDFTEQVSEVLSDVLTEIVPGLEWRTWEYWRSEVTVSGDFAVPNLDAVPEGHALAGLVFPHREWVDGVSFDSSRSRAYGGRVWVDLSEDAPFGWADDEYGGLLDDVRGFVSEVEGRLVKVMVMEWEYLTSREYLLELADLNEYTFTVDGKRFG